MTDRNASWTEERLLLMKQMEGSGPKVIWAALNNLPGPKLTKSAVIGKRSRLFGVKKPRMTEEQKAASADARRIQDAANKREKRARDRQPGSAGSVAYGVIHRIKAKTNGARAPVVEYLSRREADVQPLHVNLMDLARNACRWPYGDGPFTFCGCEKISAGPYCFAHDEISKPIPSSRKVAQAFSLPNPRIAAKSRNRARIETIAHPERAGV